MANPKQQPIQAEVSNRLNELSDRTRIIEERVSNLKDKIRITDDNLIKKTTDLNNDINDLGLQIDQLRKDIKEIQETMQNLIREIGVTAKQKDLKVLEKYINLIDPTRFLTKDDVVRLIKQEKQAEA